MSPTAPVIGLTAKEDTVLGGKYKIEKGTPIVASFSKIHRDPAVYGEDSEEFRPERMLDEEFNRRNKEFPNCWKPFGNGMRGQLLLIVYTEVCTNRTRMYRKTIRMARSLARNSYAAPELQLHDGGSFIPTSDQTDAYNQTERVLHARSFEEPYVSDDTRACSGLNAYW